MKRVTLAVRLADYFKARPGVWVNARELFIAGSFAWRTRVSDLRRPPYSMVIENRCRKVDGYTVTEYRFVPVSEQKEMSA